MKTNSYYYQSIESGYSYYNGGLMWYEQNMHNVNGWVGLMDVRFLDILGSIPLNQDGDILELGSYHGKYSIAMNQLTTNSNAECLLVDIYHKQHLNLSHSGDAYKLPEDISMEEYMREQFSRFDKKNKGRNVRCMVADTLDLIPSDFGKRRYKMVHIDAGHHRENAEHDLKLVEYAIKPEGVVILDDWMNDFYVGVNEGFWRYRHNGGHLVPFACCHGKLFLCNYSAHKKWIDYLTKYEIRFKMEKLDGYDIVNVLRKK